MEQKQTVTTPEEEAVDVRLVVRSKTKLARVKCKCPRSLVKAVLFGFVEKYTESNPGIELRWASVAYKVGRVRFKYKIEY